jgi:deoxyribodipyrimidine photo-lyase
MGTLLEQCEILQQAVSERVQTEAEIVMSAWEPTRGAALHRLDAFVARAGRDYAERRNFDYGSGNRENVSGLSPYIRRRIITEEEVVRAVLKVHPPSSAEKFVQEVLWRTYWKGWLEQRPRVWYDYLDDLHHHRLSEASEDASYQQAVTGCTGIACFDAWARELVETGYLHNHTRMWFASIWVFTLELPWVLGADFFYRHLLDADPASNTLSWRWIAGLHTRGKHYVARAANIEKYTAGRFNPRGQLNEEPEPLVEDRTYERRSLPNVEEPPAAQPALLLVTEADLLGDGFLPQGAGFRGAAHLSVPPRKQDGAVKRAFAAGALKDSLERLRRSDVPDVLPEPLSSKDLAARAKELGCDQVVVHYPCVGEVDKSLQSAEAPVVRIRRAWDESLFPHATAGYFKFKKQLPQLLKRLMA